jgi:GxxExxY protein
LENLITEDVIGGAIEVHRSLGPGLLESAYEGCLCDELHLRGLDFERQKELPVLYKGCLIDCGFRLDLLVGGAVIVEIKAVDRILPIHQAQVLTHLRMTGLRVGLILNFNSLRLTNGIKRVVLSFSEE